MDKTDLKSLTADQMRAFVRTLGWPTYRAHQLLHWIYQKKVIHFSEMTNLSNADRETLKEHASLSRLKQVRYLCSADGTQKFLYRLHDDREIEAVLIPGDDVAGEYQSHRLTLCISTQVGCTLDCRFCLTGTMGLVRNLYAHEMVEQVLETQRFRLQSKRVGTGCHDRSVSGADTLSIATRHLTNIVLMGMGEPLANYREMMEALIRLTHPQMVGISPRRITLSTAGMVPQIKLLGKSGLPVNLAISLNATTDAVREQIMPAVQRLYSLNELMAACRAYPLTHRQRLTFEYVLLQGVNDTEEDARRLVKLLRGIRCKVNLIPFNEFPGAPYRRPSDDAIFHFQKLITDKGQLTFIRSSRGRDILAACGQLRTEAVATKASYAT
jgi:23S rRNA (adenine2503-C2)-methyltransferase